MSLTGGDFIIRSGRAFLYPVYKGTYERATPDEMGPNAERELGIAWSRDLGRAIDYLETRSDIDRARLAFYGVSAGADAGVILTALEPRLKTSVLQGIGIWDVGPPEIDSRQLCAARAHPDADVEWALRLRDAVRDGATSAVRPAGNSGRAETAHGSRDRSRTADRGRGRARSSPGSTATLDRSSAEPPIRRQGRLPPAAAIDCPVETYQKGRRPGLLAGRQGFEPRFHGPEPCVLPLDDLPSGATRKRSRRSGGFQRAATIRTLAARRCDLRAHVALPPPSSPAIGSSRPRPGSGARCRWSRSWRIGHPCRPWRP